MMKEKIKEEVIDATRLFYFSKVFKRGSLNAVADELDMAQAGIGRQIQLLEDELGVRLFERGPNGRGMVTGGHGRGMVPTEAAEILYEYYCQYRDQQDKLKVALEEWRSMKRGTIHIATFTTYIDALMEEVIHDFRREHSGLAIQIRQSETSFEIINSILKDDVHIGIIYGQLDSNPDISYRKRAPLPARMLINPRHSLANGESKELFEIQSLPFVLPSASDGVNKMIESIARSEKIRLTPAFVSDSIIARKKAAIAGYGGALMSAFAARQEISTGQLVALEIDHPDFTAMEVGLIVRRGRLLSPAANQLLRLIAAKFSVFSYNASNPISKKTPLSSAVTLSLAK